MTTREDSIAAVTMLLADGPCLVSDDQDSRAEPCPALDHPNLKVDRLCRLCRWRWDVLTPIRAAIEQALKDERIRTLEAVGCEMRFMGADCITLQRIVMCTRCRMLAEAKEEGHPS